MEEKLDLDDADSSGYEVFGSLLGSWDAGCVRIGCGEDRVDLAGLASHPRRRTIGLLNSQYLLHKMVTKHTQFFNSNKTTSHSLTRDTYDAATAISCTLWPSETSLRAPDLA